MLTVTEIPWGAGVISGAILRPVEIYVRPHRGFEGMTRSVFARASRWRIYLGRQMTCQVAPLA